MKEEQEYVFQTDRMYPGSNHNPVTYYLRADDDLGHGQTFIVTEMPDNKGPRLRDVINEVIADLNTRGAGIDRGFPNFYEQKQDGTLEKVEFRTYYPGANPENEEPRFLLGEFQRYPVPQEYVERQTGLKNLEVPKPFAERQEEALRTMTTPASVTRSDASANEIAFLEKLQELRPKL